MDKVRRFLASIDIFDKSIEDEFRIRTKTGAIISMLFSSIGVILFFAQLSYFVAPDVSRNLATNKNITSDVTRVNISISLLIFSSFRLLLTHIIPNTRKSIRTTHRKNTRFFWILRTHQIPHHFVPHTNTQFPVLLA